MQTNRFKIIAGLNPSDSKVELNGVELQGVTRVSFDMRATTTGHVRLEIMGEMIVEGEYVQRKVAGTE